MAKADSGASRHYIRQSDTSILHNKTTDPHGPTVLLPNNASITATESGQLPLSNLLSTLQGLAKNIPISQIKTKQYCTSLTNYIHFLRS